MRRCKRCGKTKPLTEFYQRVRKDTGKLEIRSLCKPCFHLKRKFGEWNENQENTKRLKFESMLRRKYGMTAEEYEELKEQQQAKCAVCGTEPVDIALDVDHCHSRNVIRGLLCRKCNLGIGYFSDNAEHLIAAALYLEGARHGKRTIHLGQAAVPHGRAGLDDRNVQADACGPHRRHARSGNR